MKVSALPPNLWTQLLACLHAVQHSLDVDLGLDGSFAYLPRLHLACTHLAKLLRLVCIDAYPLPPAAGAATKEHGPPSPVPDLDAIIELREAALLLAQVGEHDSDEVCNLFVANFEVLDFVSLAVGFEEEGVLLPNNRNI